MHLSALLTLKLGTCPHFAFRKFDHLIYTTFGIIKVNSKVNSNHNFSQCETCECWWNRIPWTIVGYIHGCYIGYIIKPCTLHSVSERKILMHLTFRKMIWISNFQCTYLFIFFTMKYSFSKNVKFNQSRLYGTENFLHCQKFYRKRPKF